MVEFLYDGEELVSYTKVKVIFYIRYDTLYNLKTLYNKSLKETKQYQCKTWMELSEAARVYNIIYGTPRFLQMITGG